MIDWDDHYLIGVKRIDFEHHIFLDLINNFNDARLKDENIETLSNILDEIVLYAKFHFKSEENMMRRFNYPELAEHKNLHYQLIDELGMKVFGIQTKLYSPKEVEEFLVTWFINHVTHEDAKIGTYITAIAQTE
jgi:hemerythrin